MGGHRGYHFATTIIVHWWEGYFQVIGNVDLECNAGLGHLATYLLVYPAIIFWFVFGTIKFKVFGLLWTKKKYTQ